MVKVKTGSACSFVNVCVRSQDKTGEVRIWGLEGGCGGAAGQKAGWQGSAFDPFGPDQARLNGLLAGTQCPSEDAALARREKMKQKLVATSLNLRCLYQGSRF